MCDKETNKNQRKTKNAENKIKSPQCVSKKGKANPEVAFLGDARSCKVLTFYWGSKTETETETGKLTGFG